VRDASGPEPGALKPSASNTAGPDPASPIELLARENAQLLGRVRSKEAANEAARTRPTFRHLRTVLLLLLVAGVAGALHDLMSTRVTEQVLPNPPCHDPAGCW
jgi:hypothetical protein